MPLARFRQGTPITLREGILFATYATLRSDEREGKASRVQQIRRLARPRSTASSSSTRRTRWRTPPATRASAARKRRRCRAAPGLRLQHALPDARVVYVSATGATTVQNLAYAQRLGLWGGGDFPFATRAEFVAAMEAGGVAAMEVLARDLKALGLYAARSLSYEGVEYELLEHELTSEQIRIYDAYAERIPGHPPEPDRRPGGREHHRAGQRRDLQPQCQGGGEVALSRAQSSASSTT